MSARHARPRRWRGTSRLLAFGAASAAIATVGTTQGTGAFYYDAVHLPVSISAAPAPQIHVPDACFTGDLFSSNSGGNDVILVVGSDRADTIVLGSGRPGDDDGQLAKSGFDVPDKHAPEGGWTALYSYDPQQRKVTDGPFQQMPTGNNHAFIVLGGGGNDVILGGQHDDCIVGEAGSDLLYGGNGHDVLVGDAQDYLYSGNAKDCSLGGRVFDSNGKDVCSTPTSSGNGGSGKSKTSDQPTSSLVQQPSVQQPSDVTSADQTAGPSQEGATG